MKSHLIRSLSLLFVFSVALTSASSALAGGAKNLDELLPENTLFYIGIDDYTLFEKYAESMPVSKILEEEEVIEFLKKPKAYLEKNMEEVKAMIAAQSEELAAELDKIMGFKLARFFAAATHLKFPSPEEAGPPIPDIGLCMGFSLQGGDDPEGSVRNLVSIFSGMAGTQGVSLSMGEGEYKGVKFSKLSCPDAPFYVCFFHLGDLFVISLSETTMHQMVDLYSGASANSLANSAKYKDVADSIRLTRAGSADMYMDMQGSISLGLDTIKMLLAMEGEADIIGLVDAVSGKLGLEQLGGMFTRSLSKDGVALGEGIFSMKGEPRGLMAVFPHNPIGDTELGYIPKDVQSFNILNFDTAALYDLIMDIFKTVNEDEYHMAMEEMKGFLTILAESTQSEPIDIRRDLLGSFGTSCIFYQLGGASPMGMGMPSFTILLEIKNYGRFISTLKALIEGAAALDPSMGSSLNLATTEFLGEEIHYLQLPEVPMFSPAFAKVGDYLAIALQLDDVKKLIKRTKTEGEETVKDNEDFAKLFAKLPEGAPLYGLSYSRTKEVFSDTYNSMAMMVPMMTMALPAEIELPVDLQLLPTAESIEPYLFSTFSATVEVEEGVFKLISYGPMGAEMIRYVCPVLALIGFATKDYYATMGMGGYEMETGFDEEVFEEAELEMSEDELYAKKAGTDLGTLSTGCFIYKIEFDRYPERLEDLLTTNDNWPNGFINAKELPADPWGNPYKYKKISEGGKNYRIWSCGPNGVDEGGGGDDIVRIK